METADHISKAIQKLSDGLRIVALRALGDRDEAEDAVQEAIVRVLAAVNTKGIPQAYTLDKYLYGTLRHVITDMQRMSRRKASPIVEQLAADTASALEFLIDNERKTAVAKALEKLSDDDRALMDACYVRGERVVDIAERTGEPAERVRKRKSRALERLRALLDPNSHITRGNDD